MNNKKGLRILAVGLLYSVVLFGCSRKKDPTSTPTPDNSTPISETTSNGTSSSEKSDNPTSVTTTSDATSVTTSNTTSTTTSDTTSSTSDTTTSDTTSENTSSATSETTSTTTTSNTTSTTTSGTTSTTTVDTSSETSSGDVSSDDPIKIGAEVKIGTADATAMKEIDADPNVPEMIKQYSIEGVNVTTGDVLVFTVDGVVVEPGVGYDSNNNAVVDGTSIKIVKTATNVNIYLKAYENGGYDIHVTGNEKPDVEKGYIAKVNGEKVTVGELELGPTDAYAFTVELKKDDVLVVTNDGVALKVGETTSTEYKCAIAGVHKVYVNKQGQVWVTAPVAPVETKYTVKVNGKDVAITLIPDSENHAQFKLTLTKGDKVVVYGDGKALSGGAYTGTEYTVEATGEHTFYVNAEDVVYLAKPAVTPDPIEKGVTVTIGKGEAAEMTEIETDPEIPTMTKQYSIEGVKVSAGDKLVFTIDGKVVEPGASGEGNNAKADANGLTIVTAGEKVNIYLKVYKDGGYDVWVTKDTTTPVVKGYEAKVNGEKVTVGELELGPTDAYAFTVELKKDDVLVVTNDGVALKVGETTSTEYKCAIAGVHKVYVNKQGQVWVTAPVAPVETKYTVKVNGKDVAITLIPDSENHAQFKLTLTKGDKVVVYGDGKALSGGAYTGTEYTVEATGEHTFYVNAEDVVYLAKPAVTPDPIEKGVTVTIGKGEAAEMTEIETDPEIPTMTKQYSIEGVKVSAGDKLVFTIDGKVVEPGASGEGNNAKADANGLTIVTAGEKVNIYLKVYKDGGYDVWVTKDTTTPVTPTTDTKVYLVDNANWGKAYAYCWTDANKNAAWPGVAMTKLTSKNASGLDVYEYTIKSAYSNFIFNNNNGSQTADLSITNVTGDNIYYDVANNKWVANADDVKVSEKDCFVRGSMNGWADNDAYCLKANPSNPNERMITLTLTKNAEFKIVYKGNWYGISNVKSECKSLVSGTDNIVINEAGSYTFYFDTTSKMLYIAKN